MNIYISKCITYQVAGGKLDLKINQNIYSNIYNGLCIWEPITNTEQLCIENNSEFIKLDNLNISQNRTVKIVGPVIRVFSN